MTQSTGLVKFGGISKEAAEKALKAIKSNQNNYYKWKDGINTIRVLPPPVGKKEAWVTTYQHYFGKWANGDKSYSFNCPEMMTGGRCPACDRVRQLEATGNPIDAEKAKEWRAKLRVFMNIIDRKEPEAGVQVVAFGKMIQEQLLELVTDADVYGADFTNPFQGDDLIVKRWEENKFIKYRVNIRNGEHRRLAETEEQMVKWLENAPSLDKLATVLSYDTIVQKGAELTAEARGEPLMARRPAIAIEVDAGPGPGGGFIDSFADGVETGLTRAAASTEGQSSEIPF